MQVVVNSAQNGHGWLAGADIGVPWLAFAQLLESDALDPAAIARFRAIMSREGVDEASLQREGQVPVRWFREAYPDLDTDQAIKLGRAFAAEAHLTSFGPLSVPLVSAGSVTEVVELLAYLPLISTAVRTHFHSHDGGLTVAIVGQTGDSALDCMMVTYCGAALARLIAILVGDGSKVWLSTSWEESAPLAESDGPTAVGSASRAATRFLHIPTDTLNEVCRFSDPIAYRLAITSLRKDLECRVGQTTLSGKVMAMLDAGPGLRSSQAVADELSISCSTLKRRLQEEGTCFRDLLESSLLERAKLRLVDKTLSVSEIATELGYSDLTNFSHAFKRWTGVSPSRFRAQNVR